jgi:DNA-binding MarR family transcriptional regulator
MDKVVEKIRSFNRFYMPAMNLLGDHYLGSEYSVTEARIFFEIYENEGCTAAHIAQTMNIDKSYLSRIIRGHEKSGYIRREKASNDGRAMQLYLTDKGQKRAENFISKSNEEIEAITRDLPDDDKEKLSNALDTVMAILSKGSEKQ